LQSAHALQSIGAFQLEAAIQDAHLHRVFSQAASWENICLLYEGLIQYKKTLGALVARASAYGFWKSPDIALKMLSEIKVDRSENFQALWATKAYFEEQNGNKKVAIKDYEKAISLTLNKTYRDHLLRRKQALQA
ncbi:MAG: RNA polymerase subunit sigma-70, partial [Pseudomonadota bacterium]